MATSSVRVRPDTRAKLQELAKESGQSVADVVDAAIDAYRRRRFLLGLAADFAALRSDPQAWSQELQERAEWEVTLGDNLESE